jgi:rhodanese-related sulfurtransferase
MVFLKNLRVGSIVLVLLGFVTVLSACGSNELNTKSVHVNVNFTEAKALIDGGIDVLDVRTAAEYAEGHIEGAMLYPLQELPSRIKELGKDAPYLIVCRSGNRSAQAQSILANAGFKKTYNLLGGMNEWPYETVK